jgi:hypothetical protein
MPNDNDDDEVRIHPDHLHLAPAVGVALSMTPAEARRIGRLRTRLKRDCPARERRHLFQRHSDYRPAAPARAFARPADHARSSARPGR